MSGSWSGTQLVAGVAGAAVLFLLELGLSVALGAVAALSRVSLHRLGGVSNGQDFLAEMHQPPSAHRTAAMVLQQACLLGATLLLVLTARGFGWPQPELIGLALGVGLGVGLVEGVAAPALALWEPRVALRLTLPLVRVAHALLYPVVRPLMGILERIGDSAQTEEEREEEQEEEVEALIEVGEREGLLEAEEGAMMRGIVDLDETLVREIMTPAPNIVAIPVETTVAEARRKLVESAHTRLPVYRGSLDNVVGILHARDLFQAWEEHEDRRSVKRYVRPATFVPEVLSAAELLSTMRLKTRVAMVVDEYGGIAGLVTLEDLLEEIVGEIRDEHDAGEEEVVRREPDGSYRISASAHVDELERLFDVEFKDRDFDTVGGLVVRGFGRVPAEGETLTTEGLQIDVLRADPRRILEVRVRPLPPSAGARAGQ